MVVQHNISSLFAQNKLKTVTDNKSKASEQLSSGYRINRAADDAAGLTISEKMRWQIRGLEKASFNVDEGISLLNVADGALAEVHSMLDRMKELTTQGANDTNTAADRDAIQKELDSLTSEIDRISSTTEFNTQKLFSSFTTITGPGGSSIPVGDIPFSEISLVGTTLGENIFGDGDLFSRLNLSATSSADYGNNPWALLFGRSARAGLRISYLDGSGNTVTDPVSSTALSGQRASNFQYDSATNTYSRMITYAAPNGGTIGLVQTVQIGNHETTSQYYNISYEIQNNLGVDASIDLLFDADTSYGGGIAGDSVESYYIGGQRVNNYTMYTAPGSTIFTDTSCGYVEDISTLSNGFSIINSRQALQFSENIRWGSGDTPDAAYIGNFYKGREWADYNSASPSGMHLGASTGTEDHSADLGFKLIWNRSVSNGASSTVSFQYGIVQTDTDPNLSGVPITYDPTIHVATNEDRKFWIQSGATDQNGLFVTIGAMNSNLLGIDQLSVASYADAGTSMEKVENAIAKVSENRSRIGAQQNRLEHNRSVDDIIHQNTQSAESRIRDADLAKVMVAFSAYDIIQQAGQSMLAQGNQSKQRVLELLQ
ncbi:MAG: flagellin [Roseburia sp.]